MCFIRLTWLSLHWCGTLWAFRFGGFHSFMVLSPCRRYCRSCSDKAAGRGFYDQGRIFMQLREEGFSDILGVVSLLWKQRG